ncbi:MAG: hypothetical protein LBF54_01000 [Holosporaceae bacterium]|jgi:hypothetical protein|nr:hypothetical protein [Holosporaceae bacterium]
MCKIIVLCCCCILADYCLGGGGASIPVASAATSGPGYNIFVVKISTNSDLSLRERVEYFKKLLALVRNKNKGQFPPPIDWRFNDGQVYGDTAFVDLHFISKYTSTNFIGIGARLMKEMKDVSREGSGPFFFGIKDEEGRVIYHSWK